MGFFKNDETLYCETKCTVESKIRHKSVLIKIIHANKGQTGQETSNAIDLKQTNSPDSEHAGVPSNYVLSRVPKNLIWNLGHLGVRVD